MNKRTALSNELLSRERIRESPEYSSYNYAMLEFLLRPAIIVFLMETMQDTMVYCH